MMSIMEKSVTMMILIVGAGALGKKVGEFEALSPRETGLKSRYQPSVFFGDEMFNPNEKTRLKCIKVVDSKEEDVIEGVATILVEVHVSYNLGAKNYADTDIETAKSDIPACPEFDQCQYQPNDYTEIVEYEYDEQFLDLYGVGHRHEYVFLVGNSQINPHRVQLFQGFNDVFDISWYLYLIVCREVNVPTEDINSKEPFVQIIMYSSVTELKSHDRDGSQLYLKIWIVERFKPLLLQ